MVSIKFSGFFKLFIEFLEENGIEIQISPVQASRLMSKLTLQVRCLTNLASLPRRGHQKIWKGCNLGRPLGRREGMERSFPLCIPGQTLTTLRLKKMEFVNCFAAWLAA